MLPMPTLRIAILVTMFAPTLSWGQPTNMPTASEPPVAATEIRVPRVLRISGAISGLKVLPETSTQAITFALYKDEVGGTPIWTETQEVQIGAAGTYTALLGAANPDGLSLDLFSTADARWLGVQVSGQEEQPRIMFVSVPYALKAADAESLGGKPASVYVTTEPVVDTPNQAGLANRPATGSAVPGANAAKASRAVSGQAAINGSGTQNFVTKFIDTVGDIGNSLIFDDGQNVGIGNSAPGSRLSILLNSSKTGYGGTSNGHQGIVVNNANNTLGKPVGVEFGTYSNGPGNDYTFGGLYGVGTSMSNFTQGDLALAFRRNSADTFFTEVMRLQGATGHIGIGTSSPSDSLDVVGKIGILGSGNGIIFPDSSIQTTATLKGDKGDVGPQGPQGLQGPPGPPTHTTAVCAQAPQGGTSCSCAVRLIIMKTAPNVAGGSSCMVTSDTGSCSANGTFDTFGNNFSGACCVCAVQ